MTNDNDDDDDDDGDNDDDFFINHKGLQLRKTLWTALEKTKYEFVGVSVVLRVLHVNKTEKIWGKKRKESSKRCNPQ